MALWGRNIVFSSSSVDILGQVGEMEGGDTDVSGVPVGGDEVGEGEGDFLTTGGDWLVPGGDVVPGGGGGGPVQGAGAHPGRQQGGRGQHLVPGGARHGAVKGDYLETGK